MQKGTNFKNCGLVVSLIYLSLLLGGWTNITKPLHLEPTPLGKEATRSAAGKAGGSTSPQGRFSMFLSKWSPDVQKFGPNTPNNLLGIDEYRSLTIGEFLGKYIIPTNSLENGTYTIRQIYKDES